MFIILPVKPAVDNHWAIRVTRKMQKGPVRCSLKISRNTITSLGSCSERMDDHYSTEEDLLAHVQGLELMSLTRKDECCGFGGTFAVFEEAISVKMGKDRIQDHLNNDVEVITGADHSCLMHLEGLINRNKQPIRVMHIAEILNSSI